MMLHELVIHLKIVFTVNLLKNITFSLKDMVCSVKDKGRSVFYLFQSQDCVCARRTWLLKATVLGCELLGQAMAVKNEPDV